MRFLPQMLKEILKNVPSLLFDVVDWKELTHVLPLMSKRMMNKDQIQPLIAEVSSSFAPYKLVFTDESKGVKTTLNSEVDRKLIAQSLLQAYFQQLFNQEGQLLDMRADFFTYENGITYWKPNGMWAQWHEEFRIGLVEVYKGFFLEDEPQFRRGLKSIGLIQADWNQEEQDQMTVLFRNHFKNSLSENMLFSIDDFKNSFLNIFNFLLQKKVRMSADFMYLGVMLIGLYTHLEELKTPLNVKDIFMSVLKNNE